MHKLQIDENIASYIAGMNGDKRGSGHSLLSPQETKFPIVPDPHNKFEGIGINVAQGITWTREEGSRQQQHEYLIEFFGQEATDGYFQFLMPGENRTQAKG